MTTKIDPKKIEEYRALAAAGYPLAYTGCPSEWRLPREYFGGERAASEAIGALLAEREDLIRERDEAFDAGLEEGALCAERCEKRTPFSGDPRHEAQRGAYTEAAASIRRLKGHPSPLRVHPTADREETLSLLREVEWQGDEGTFGVVCVICGQPKPEEYDRMVRIAEGQRDLGWRDYFRSEIANATRGHAASCRLAALLGGKR
jgi:hypothetical protein